MTNEMWQRMQDPLVILPRRPDASSANHTEIYLPEQVVIVFVDDKPALISHISSGERRGVVRRGHDQPRRVGNEDGTEPLKRGECGLSNTPGGVFEYYRRVEGVRESALGGMWNPVYFNYGIAIHGALNVPLQPASHGCIRIPLTLSEYFQQLVADGDQVYVFDGVKEPEEYGAQLPTFNWRDPNYTTTTTAPPPTTTPPPTPAPAPPRRRPATDAGRRRPRRRRRRRRRRHVADDESPRPATSTTARMRRAQAGSSSTRRSRTASSSALRSLAAYSSRLMSAPGGGLDVHHHALGLDLRPHATHQARVAAVEADRHAQDAGERPHQRLVAGVQGGELGVRRSSARSCGGSGRSGR